jgi:hypothetical protein
VPARDVDRDGLCPCPLRHQRVERVRGPRRHQLVPLVEQHQRGGLEQLGRPVPQHDLLGLDLMALGEELADARGMAVRIAVDPSARGVDRRVHDLGVREVGPLRARQVDRRHLRECELALALAPRAQFAVHRLLVDVVELPVVVE